MFEHERREHLARRSLERATIAHGSSQLRKIGKADLTRFGQVEEGVIRIDSVCKPVFEGGSQRNLLRARAFRPVHAVSHPPVMPAERIGHELAACCIPFNCDLRARSRMIDRLTALQTLPEADARFARIMQQSERAPPCPHVEFLCECLRPPCHLVRMLRKRLPGGNIFRVSTGMRVVFRHKTSDRLQKS